MSDINTQYSPLKSSINKTTPGAPKKNKTSKLNVNLIVPREGPLF